MTTTRPSIFTLPPVKERTIERKRLASSPDLTTLTKEQKVACKALQKFLANDDGGLFLLEGYAGTGKTYVSSKVVEWYLATYNGMVAVTAPTNKAVKVLTGMADYTHKRLEYRTVHSLLGLKENIDKNGKQEFVRSYTEDSSIEDFSLLILDEVSQLQDDLFDMLMESVEHGLKILFMGDSAQIPPVGKIDCKPFNPAIQKKLGITKATLKTIVRQSKGNPIIDAAFQVRDNLTHEEVFTDREGQHTKEGLVMFLNMGIDIDKSLLNQLLKVYFTSDNFKADADFAKVIAWRNKTVSAVNGRIRKMIFGDNARKLEVGEKLIANKPIFEDGAIIMSTNEEMEVVEIEEAQGVTKDNDKLNHYKVKVEYFAADNHKSTRIIKVVHEDSMVLYHDIVRRLARKAKAEKSDYKRVKLWKAFYRFQRTFADVGYNYAITAHKAQASTYDNVIVMEYDIDFNRKIVERNRIKYTACSRPRSRLFVVY